MHWRNLEKLAPFYGGNKVAQIKLDASVHYQYEKEMSETEQLEREEILDIFEVVLAVSKTPKEMGEALGLDTETMRPFKDFLKAVRDDNPDVLRDRLMEGGTEHLETFKRDYSGGIEKYFKEVATWMDASDDLDGMDYNEFRN